MTVASLDRERNDALLSWYGERRRPLPWRESNDPYRILVSEVMLQQTQVDRVVPYFERFIARFPTTDALASAPLRDVLDAWSGLGYNARAQRLREAARIITDDGWPTTPPELEELPGVGPYTAAAVASIAFGANVAAVDTNLQRVLSRWHGEVLRGAPLHAVASGVLGEPASDWNQAMMDLGSSVCSPRSPVCGECPVKDWCAGPDAYAPPTPQGRFEGSARQLRGAVVRSLVGGPSTVRQLSQQTGFSAADVRFALEDLSDEDLVKASEDGTYSIAE
ncbi:MAG: A/G-specific adenine glycosylase [Actinomycetota bacterium]